MHNHQALRRREVGKLRTLRENDLYLNTAPLTPAPSENRLSGLELYIAQAELSLPPTVVGAALLFAGGLVGSTTALVLPPVFALLGALLAIGTGGFLIDSRRFKRALRFNADYPSVLLAMSSSLKVGLSPITALEGAVAHMDEANLVRREVTTLLDNLRRGIAKKRALELFAQTVALAELDLFRQAFTLVLEHGGRFSPTLERLAKVSRDRASLIHGATVSTTTMRMTANVLLLITPLIPLILSSHSKSYWETLRENPTANTCAGAGLFIILGSYLTLQLLSRFRP
jgi:Flp pilus assembly protein TadB